ncbi:hypothetical protein [Metapseudomonas otitidis]|uniref:hypothetical protein n=1 Tax=Metapseudomonas otitidis TaxID=319939 RepID=UPI00244ADF22|nr:hypothetical protein [Pseudomonas otitidis]MDG9782610.1 hypothetical protein [Pseudomonas otitidis]
MSRLTHLIEAARGDLPPWVSTPAERWDAIASECGADEVLEIEQRLYALRLELDAVEDWDGDTRDDIHKAIEQFSRLLQLALLRVGAAWTYSIETLAGPLEGDALQAARRWLAGLPEGERLEVLKGLWHLHFRRALALMQGAQLSRASARALCRYWLQYGGHNAAQMLIKAFVPVLGEARFWQLAAESPLLPAMAEFLDYASNGRLSETRAAKRT